MAWNDHPNPRLSRLALAACALGLASSAPGCADFGYGPFSDKLRSSIDRARVEGREAAEQAALDTPEVDELLNECAPEDHEGPWGPELHAAVVASGLGAEAAIAAHARAVRGAIREVQICLVRRSETDLFSAFGRAARTAFPFGQPIANPTVDAQKLLRIINATADEPRGRAILQLYGERFLREVDVFGAAVQRGLDAGPALSPAEGPAAAESVESDADGLLVVRLRRLDHAAGMEEAAQRVAAALPQASALLLDLRWAAGGSLEALQPLAAALAEAAVPATLWVDGLTRGTAEWLALEIARRPGTLVLGARSFGYPLRRCRIPVGGEQGRWDLVRGCALFELGDGRPAPRSGLSPDLALEATPEGIAEELRLQSERILPRAGISVLVNALAATGPAQEPPVEEGRHPAPDHVAAVRTQIVGPLTAGEPLEGRVRAGAALWARLSSGNSTATEPTPR
ncbi:MAG: hypothetical protein IT285_02360 [Bdellovibrionales bacterium]|nr:hypothetical protein [Bdellovibrionales bacterium]